jgi:putative peptidoglycan lipid II flippase
MAAVTLVSRLSGYARDKVVAALIGAGVVGDAFVAGFRIPNMFRAFLAEGALHAAFVPVLAGLREERDEERTRQFVGAMVSCLLLVLPLLVAGGMLAAPALVQLFAAAFADDPAKFALAVRLTRLMFPYLALISLAALAQGVLNSAGRFLLPAATPVALNLAIVAGAVTASESLGGRSEWLAAGVVAGGFLQLAMQWQACRRLGLPLLPGRGALRHPLVRKVFRLMVPGVPALGIYQITILLSTRFAASVGEGALMCLYNATRINELVYGVVVVQLATAVLPMLSAERLHSPETAHRTLAFSLRLLSLVTLPAAALSAVLARPLAGALLGGGKYGAEAVAMTAAALWVYSLGMPFLALVKILGGASFAWLDTRTPLWGAAVNLAVFACLGTVWTAPYGVAGVAGAAVAGQLANACTLLLLNGLRGRLPEAGEVLPAVLRHLAASAVAGAVAWALQRQAPPLLTTSLPAFATLGGIAAAAAAAYVGALALVRAPELAEAMRLLRGGRGIREKGPGAGREEDDRP